MKIAEVIVANSDNIFDLLFTESSLIAPFISALDGERYGSKDNELREMIDAIGRQLFAEEFAERHLHMNWDCWPNHTRYVDCNAQLFSLKFFNALHELLTGKYDEWRIQIVIYQDMMDGKTQIGSVAMWSDKLLIDRKLYDWMIENQFDFGAEANPRFVDDNPEAIRKSEYTLLDHLDCWPY